MKLHKYIAYMLSAVVAAAGLTACDEDPELPPVNAPEVPPTVRVNTSILDLKTTYWSNDRNYADTVGLTPDGEHVIVAGRVISCDSTGNIYKSLIIQDATAAMAISLDSTKIFQNYPVGEEVYIDMTGMNVGKYNGLFQMGKPNPYNDTYEISFMPYWKFNSVAMRNGLPDVTKVDTVYTSIERIKSWTSQDSVIRYQSQLICLKDVEFVGGGKLTWADNGANANRQLRDSLGNTITVRNSGYASFGRDVMPAGTGTVVCILSYYGTGWQILFRTALDCHDFTGIVTPDEPVEGDGDGSLEKPFTVGQIIGGSKGNEVWTTGYIVGWIDGKSLSEGARFTAEGATATNLLIAATADEKNLNSCIPVQLSTPVRPVLNLQDNPGNLGKQISIKGNIESYFGKTGIKNTTLFNWGDKGAETNPETPDTPDTPDTPAGEEAMFKKVDKITSGKQYVLVASGKLALPLEKTFNYGYIKTSDVNVDGESLKTSTDNAFTFTAVEGGYAMTDCYGRYYYMTGSFNSFNVDKSVKDGSVWTITPQEGGTMVINNVSMNKSIQYDKQYGSYGAYSDVRGEYPVFYEIVK